MTSAGIKHACLIHVPRDVSSCLAGIRQCRVDEPSLPLGHFDQLGAKASYSIRVILHDELAIALIDFVDAGVRRHAENVPPRSLTVPGRCVGILASPLPARRFFF